MNESLIKLILFQIKKSRLRQNYFQIFPMTQLILWIQKEECNKIGLSPLVLCRLEIYDILICSLHRSF